jgi:hypothetical protein
MSGEASYETLRRTRTPARSALVEERLRSMSTGQLWQLVNSKELDSIEQAVVLGYIRRRFLTNQEQFNKLQACGASGAGATTGCIGEPVLPSDFMSQNLNEEADPSLAWSSAYPPMARPSDLQSSDFQSQLGDRMNQRQESRFTDSIDLGTILRRAPCQIDTPYER